MGKRILVADDSVTIQRAFAMVFGVEDVTLVGARSWDEAVSAARQQRPDLIFADINLGDRSGYDLCSTLKGDAALAQVPIYILASNQVPFEAGKGEQCRADGHFIKPFDSQKLLEAVAKIWSESPPVAAPSAFETRGSDVPVAVPTEDTSRVDVGHLGFEDEDSYGEFTIEPTAGGPPAPHTPPPVRTLPPVTLPPAPARPMASPGVSRPIPAPPPMAPIARPPLPVGPPPVARPAIQPSAPRPAFAAPAPMPLAASSSEPTAPKSPPRPSLIPGVMPPRAGAEAGMLGRGGAVGPAPAAPVDFGRTMMGMHAAAVPQRSAPVVAPSERPSTRSNLPASLFDDVVAKDESPPPSRPLVDMPTPLGGKAKDAVELLQDRGPAPLSAKVSESLDSKMAALAARGPEYEAIAKLSREIIEQVVWEVVPELAEIMIREQIERLAKR